MREGAQGRSGSFIIIFIVVVERRSEERIVSPLEIFRVFAFGRFVRSPIPSCARHVRYGMRTRHAATVRAARAHHLRSTHPPRDRR